MPPETFNTPFKDISRGDTFPTWQLLKWQIQQWAVIEHFAFITPRKDHQYVTYACHDVTCLWTVKGRLNDELVWEVYEINSDHTCLNTGPVSRSVANTQRWVSSSTQFPSMSLVSNTQQLRETIPHHLVVTKDTTPKQIQDCIALIYRQDVNYQAAHRAKQALLDNTLRQHREAFTKLPSYVDRLKEFDPEGHYHLGLEDDQCFGRIFVAPSASRSCLSECRRVVGFDGTFLTGKFVLTLLLAVGIDANGETTILAWAIVESENLESWKYFFSHLQLAMPEVFQELLVTISDRDKGLNAGNVKLELPDTVVHVLCCQHLKENMAKRRGGPPLYAYFWKIVKATTVEKFTYHMNELRKVPILCLLY